MIYMSLSFSSFPRFHPCPIKLDLFAFQDAKQSLQRYTTMSYPAGPEMASMFQFYQDGVDRDIELTRKLNPKVCDFQTFVQNHKKELSQL